MAYTTIDDPTIYFNTILYTGDGSTSNAITGVGFQPDWVWIKRRNNGNPHFLNDIVRGATKDLRADNTDAETTNNQYGILKSFDSDGFTVSVGSTNGARANTSGGTFVAWNWKGGGSASSNSNGSITSSVSANTTAGFSIVTWTGSGSDATIGHGLNSAPEMFVVKNRSDSADWRVGQTVAGNTMTGGNGYYMEWNDDKASTNPGSATIWGSTPTAPTSSVFTVGSNNAQNGSSDNMLAYCFHSVKGYSKIGSYIGNGNANGTFVYTGFKPAWVIGKATSREDVWWMYDIKRNTFNAMNDRLMIQSDSAESEEWDIDYLSNGFKIRSNDAQANGSGETYFYMAFAEAPFVSSGTKAAGTAK